MLIIGLIPFIFSFHLSHEGKVSIICARIGQEYINADKLIGLNLTNYVVMVVNNTGSPVAICYIRTNSTTISFNQIFIVNNNKYLGDTIPSGINNITLLINGTISQQFYVYLSNSQTICVKSQSS